MSHLRSRPLRALAVGAAIATSASLSLVAGAQAATSFELQCRWPSAGLQPATLTLSPERVSVAGGTRLVITSQLDLGSTLATSGAVASVETVTNPLTPELGTAAELTVVSGDVGERKWFALPFAKVTAPGPGPLVLTGKSTVVYPDSVATLAYRDFRLNLRVTFDGERPAAFQTPATDVQGQAWTDVDGDSGTVNLPCRATPANPYLAWTPTVDVTPPSVPTYSTAWVSGDIGATFVNLRWGTSYDPPGGSGLKEYVIDFDGAPAGGVRVSAGTLQQTIDGLGPDFDRTFFVRAVDVAGNASAALEIDLNGVCSGPCGGGLPPVTGLTVDPTATTAAISWDALPAESGVARYEVSVLDGLPSVETTATTFLATGLKPGWWYDAQVVAIDDEGNRGEPAVAEFFTDPDTTAPSVPIISVGPVTQTTATITWTPSADDVGVTGYEVYLGTTEVATTDAATRTFTFTGLTAGAAYLAKVVAFDDAGNRGIGGTATWKIGVPPLRVGDYTLAGSTTLKTLVRGTLGLSGSLNGTFDDAGRTYTGNLALADATARLVVSGFLPITAKIAFSPSGQTTGVYADNVFSTSSKVRIKVRGQIKLFGAIPLAGGNNCQTKQLTELALKSAPGGFTPSGGGSISGTYKISDLNGCGPLTGLISPATAGGGNAITLALAPKTT